MSKFDIAGLRKEYSVNHRYYCQIVEEVSHVLQSMIAISDIKIHNIVGRVKDIESLIEKSIEKELTDPIKQIKDISGVRVVCLFRDDLRRLEKLICENFSVISQDDKISSSEGFGYMSIHYICSLRETFSGPRYDNIKGFVFEIQTRTICMDAWAAVSHYLAYKGQWDVPVELQKAMNALSGLFYVADSEFQQIYGAKSASTNKAHGDISDNTLVSVPVNLDTITAYIKKRFPDRRVDDSSSISNLVHQIQLSGYETIEQIEKDVNSAVDLMESGEKSDPPGGPVGTYTAVGALRQTLAIANEEMERLRSLEGKAPYDRVSDRMLREEFLKRQKRAVR